MARIGTALSLACMAACLAASVAIAPAPARAQGNTSVMVLGIRSIDGDDDFARSLTGALRYAAAQVPGWSVSNRDVSLAQMSLAHGCDEPDAACMADIARGLHVQRVVYGTIRRTSASSNYNFAVSLYLYNAQSGQIEEGVTDSIPPSLTDIDNLRTRVRDYIARLAGQTQPGSVRIATGVAGAGVEIDGRQVGRTDAHGDFVKSDLSPGHHEIRVIAPQHEPFQGTVTVVPDQEVSLSVTLGAVGSGGSVNWLAVGLLGGGVVAGGLTVFSWITMNNINHDADFQDYRHAVPDKITDVCANLSAGPYGLMPADRFRHVQSECSQANAFQVLQYIFLGAAIAGLGAGTYLLVKGGSHDNGQETPNASAQGEGLRLLAVNPSVGPGGASLSATLSF